MLADDGFAAALALLLSRPCAQMAEPPQGLHELLWRLCSKMTEPSQILHELLWQLCSQTPCFLHSQHRHFISL
jgi:hypothetical protein